MERDSGVGVCDVDVGAGEEDVGFVLVLLMLMWPLTSVIFWAQSGWDESSRDR